MIAAFKQRYPEARLSVVVTSQVEPLLRSHPAIERVFVIDNKRDKRKSHPSFRSLFELASQLRLCHFDLLLAPHDFSPSLAMLAFLSSISVRCGYADNDIIDLIYHRKIKRDKSSSKTAAYLEFLHQALASPDVAKENKKFSHKPWLEVDREAYSAAKQLLMAVHAHRPILIAPASPSDLLTKSWPTWHYSVLIGKLVRTYHKDVFLVGGLQDAATLARIMHFVKAFQPHWIQNKVHDIAAKLSFPALYGLMRNSSLMVSNDSEYLPLAWAAGMPVLAIFGPTTPQTDAALDTDFSWASVEKKDLNCRPCCVKPSEYSHCPQDHFRCMKEITPLEVMARISSLTSIR